MGAAQKTACRSRGRARRRCCKTSTPRRLSANRQRREGYISHCSCYIATAMPAPCTASIHNIIPSSQTSAQPTNGLFRAMMPLTTTSVKTVHRSKDELVPHVSGRVRAAQAEVAALVYYPRVSYVRRSFRAAGARVSRLIGKVNVPRPTTAATSPYRWAGEVLPRQRGGSRLTTSGFRQLTKPFWCCRPPRPQEVHLAIKIGIMNFGL